LGGFYVCFFLFRAVPAETRINTTTIPATYVLGNSGIFGVGVKVGFVVGATVAVSVAVGLGVAVGAVVGVTTLDVGTAVGAIVGAIVGVAVGAIVGVAVGAIVGVAVGAIVGVAVGASVGLAVGAIVAVGVGEGRTASCSVSTVPEIEPVGIAVNCKLTPEVTTLTVTAIPGSVCEVYSSAVAVTLYVPVARPVEIV